jgi:endonuclease-3
MNPKTRLVMFERLAELNPDPRTELLYETPFQLLIAVLLSAQATDQMVNKVTRTLFAQAPDALSILALGESQLLTHLSRLNYYKTKAHHVILTCDQLLRLHGGEVPQTRAELEALPGVGRKTANVVLNTAFRQIAMAVDTHIFRVANRTGLAKGTTVRAVEDALMLKVPKAYLLDAHHWLILHGRYICKAMKPLCHQCPIADVCDHYRPSQRQRKKQEED